MKSNRTMKVKINKKHPQQSLKICRGYLFVFCNTIIVVDRRGRRSLQGEIKLPYENQPFAFRFCLPTGLIGKNIRQEELGI